MTATADDIAAQLARDGVDPSRMGQAYAQRAYPNLAAQAPLDVYGLGFSDGVRAALALVSPIMHGIIDVPEAMARLCDPDALPVANNQGTEPFKNPT